MPLYNDSAVPFENILKYKRRSMTQFYTVIYLHNFSLYNSFSLSF